jgi:hypothetical protein
MLTIFAGVVAASLLLIVTKSFTKVHPLGWMSERWLAEHRAAEHL